MEYWAIANAAKLVMANQVQFQMQMPLNWLKNNRNIGFYFFDFLFKSYQKLLHRFVIYVFDSPTLCSHLFKLF
jgi:hypothetical protein